MRQLTCRVPQGCGPKVADIVCHYQGVNTSRVDAKSENGEPIEIITTNIENSQVEAFLQDLEVIPDLHITLIPRGAIALKPPPSKAPDQLTDVTARSPLEIFLAGLQSIGSWKSFLGYAFIAGVVVWIGLFTNTSYLLVAAMLIAPFAGPAMNVAIATARGDSYLLTHSLLRYGSSIAVTIATTFVLSLILRQEIATSMMISTSEISAVTILLPLAAGAAGSLNLVQSERSSLVSGTAVGMLVAASLAPPAGLVGMAAAINDWAMAKGGFFQLLLQLVGINLTAAIIFRLYGLSVQGARYDRGKRWLFPVSLGATVVAIASLLTWQFSRTPYLQRSSQAQRIAASIQQTMQNTDQVRLVETNVRFTRADTANQNTLLGVVYVQRQPGVTASASALRDSITRQLQTEITANNPNVTPLVDVIVLETP